MDLNDVADFAAVCRAGGFRQAAKAIGRSPSALSEAVRRLEKTVRLSLLHRTMRNVAPTEVGRRLLDGIGTPLDEIGAVIASLDGLRHDDGGVLKLHVPTVAARLVLPPIIERFLASYPLIRVEMTVDDNPVDMIGANCDAGVRYEELIAADMVAIPIGPERQRLVTAAAPAYLEERGRPQHPRDLLRHACLRHRFPHGAMPAWTFERDREVVNIVPAGQLVVSTGAADVEVSAARAGLGIVYLFEEWLEPYLRTGELEAVLEDWWTSFSGPCLYFAQRALLPRPLRLFTDFVKVERLISRALTT